MSSMHDYAFYYTDGSCVIYTLSDEHYETIQSRIIDGIHVAVLSGFGILYLNELRAIVKQEELEEQSFTPDLSPQEIEYIKWLRQAEQEWGVFE